MDDLLYQIGITLIPGVGPVTAKNLVSYCGGVKAVFEARKKEISKIPGIGDSTTKAILEQEVLLQAEKEIDFIKKQGVSPLFYLDKQYPSRLKNYPDSPVMLYFKGNANLNAERIVAIVGTRKPSIHGINTCEDIVRDLKNYDVSIISGLAYGIDVTAHRKCVRENIPTIGALGHGFSMIYPYAHKDTAQKMLQNGGLLTEYTHLTGPDREHFPMRNRIIAGMCDALIVVETANKGGSMISAYIANDYNKDVFAVPGRLNDKYSAGCNLLIKSHKAALLQNAEDIAYIMRWNEKKAPASIQKMLFNELTESEKLVVDLLQKTEILDIDTLAYQSQMTYSQLATQLLNLEFQGLIKTLPGKRFMLV